MIFDSLSSIAEGLWDIGGSVFTDVASGLAKSFISPNKTKGSGGSGKSKLGLLQEERRQRLAKLNLMQQYAENIKEGLPLESLSRPDKSAHKDAMRHRDRALNDMQKLLQFTSKEKEVLRKHLNKEGGITMEDVVTLTGEVDVDSRPTNRDDTILQGAGAIYSA